MVYLLVLQQQTQVFPPVSWHVLPVAAALLGYIPDRQDSYRFAGVLVRHEHFARRYYGCYQNSGHICSVPRNTLVDVLYTAVPDRHSLL